jgi:hypothetical protein
LAFFGSLFVWGEGFLFSFPSGVDYRFPATDILVNAPASPRICFCSARVLPLLDLGTLCYDPA